MTRDRLTLDNTMLAQATTYLAMWKALESFDPAADYFSEPWDFGPQSQRLTDAETAIVRLQSLDTLPSLVGEDIVRFRALLHQLASGHPFSDDIRSFSDLLGDRGTQLAFQSVVRESGIATS